MLGSIVTLYTDCVKLFPLPNIWKVDIHTHILEKISMSTIFYIALG